AVELQRTRIGQQAWWAGKQGLWRAQRRDDEEVDREKDKSEHRYSGGHDQQHATNSVQGAGCAERPTHASRSACRARGSARKATRISIMTPIVAASLKQKPRKPSS